MSHQTAGEARLIVLGVLLASFAWAVIIPWSLTAPPTGLPGALYAVGLAAFGAVLFRVLRSSVAPAGTARWSASAQLVAAAAALWMPAHLWAEPGEHPWAWLAGFAIAACALRGAAPAVATGAVLSAAAFTGGEVFQGAGLASLVTTLGTACAVWAMSQALVWLLKMLRATQAARDAQSELATARERLRAGRELHDVLGHHLSVIALKAELAAGYAGHDPARARTESNEIRRLAADTLHDARRVVQDRMVTDLQDQLSAARLVLVSAGIGVTVDAPADVLQQAAPACSELLATVTREAVTNVLRHSEATHAAISLAASGAQLHLTIANDGVTGSPGGDASGGTGLAGLAARCRALGADLTVTRDRSRFELVVACPAETTTSR